LGCDAGMSQQISRVDGGGYNPLGGGSRGAALGYDAEALS
jgi:hypothetical protein